MQDIEEPSPNTANDFPDEVEVARETQSSSNLENTDAFLDMYIRRFTDVHVGVGLGPSISVDGPALNLHLNNIYPPRDDSPDEETKYDDDDDDDDDEYDEEGNCCIRLDFESDESGE